MFIDTRGSSGVRATTGLSCRDLARIGRQGANRVSGRLMAARQLTSLARAVETDGKQTVGGKKYCTTICAFVSRLQIAGLVTKQKKISLAMSNEACSLQVKFFSVQTREN